MSTPLTRIARRTLLVPAVLPPLLAACSDGPVAAKPYPPGPSVTKTAVLGGGDPGSPIPKTCPAQNCTLPQPRILFSDTTQWGWGEQYSINPDGTGIAVEMKGVQSAAWLPSYKGYVGVMSDLTAPQDIISFPSGKAYVYHRYTHSVYSDVDPAVSPDGSLIAFASDELGKPGHHKIFAVPMSQVGENTELNALSFDDGDARWPHWSPDGKSIVYASDHPLTGGFALPEYHIWVMNANGNSYTYLSMLEGRYPVYSPDGTRVAFTTATSGGDRIAILTLATKQVTIVQNGLTSSLQPSWSPDGKMLAFASADAKWRGVNVMNADGTGVKHVANNGALPKWSR